ncbi:MAG: putative porin [Bacteroidales bacterium]|nr:putative porin [Bacteroidales bacterium]
MRPKVKLLIILVLLLAGCKVMAQSVDSLPARDSLALPLSDSLALPLKDSTDSLRIPNLDSTGRQIPDSLGYIYQLDSLGLIQVDSLGFFVIDSLATFSKKELRQFARQKRKEEKAIADSIYKSTFHMLDTYVVPDSLMFRKVISWTHDTYFNKLNFKDIDTNINNSFYDYAHMKEDVGAIYLGTAGSPVLSFNYFKRKTKDRFGFWDGGMSEAYDRETLPAYNAKSPFTVMSYSGTLFANKEKEELNVGLLHTQNLSPEANIQFFYQRKGAKGMLQNEATNTRTLAITTNYLGKRYVMHGGYIRNSLRKSENGGIQDDLFITDTIVDARTIPIWLSKASSALASDQLFITHSLGVPINLFRRDSIAPEEGTVMYLGHAGQWNSMSRNYTDEIGLPDHTGRKFYNHQFHLDPLKTTDSVQTMIFDNRFFLRLQPWSATAILSGLEGGVGYELLSHYCFVPDFYTAGPSNQQTNNAYAYAGAYGMLKKYFAWNAIGRLDFAGYYLGDMSLDANVRFSFYPLPSGIHLKGRFLFKRQTPDWYINNYYSNHYVWENDFSKTTRTQIHADLSIPDWKTRVSFSYGLAGNTIYYDTLGVVRQAERLVNIMTATAEQNFSFWYVRLNHRLLFQLSSQPEIVPLPLLAANLRYYLEIPVVKNVMTAQIGADVTFHTAYYMEAYNPALGNFHLQQEKKYGNTPYIDVFVNMKWKRATLYVKYINAAQGWPDSGYFSAPHYIRPQRVVKLGITWPFYVKPSKTGSVDSSKKSDHEIQNTHRPGGGISTGRPVR